MNGTRSGWSTAHASSVAAKSRRPSVRNEESVAANSRYKPDAVNGLERGLERPVDLAINDAVAGEDEPAGIAERAVYRLASPPVAAEKQDRNQDLAPSRTRENMARRREYSSGEHLNDQAAAGRIDIHGSPGCQASRWSDPGHGGNESKDRAGGVARSRAERVRQKAGVQKRRVEKSESTETAERGEGRRVLDRVSSPGQNSRPSPPLRVLTPRRRRAFPAPRPS